MGTRRPGQPRRTHPTDTAEREFPTCLVRVDLRTGNVRMLEFDEVQADERDEVTRWVLRLLKSVGLPPADPLQLRDAIWG